MFLWRISNHSTLDGRGGLLASARWHSQGRTIVYLATSPAGSLLEVLVHLELSPSQFPETFNMLKAEAPEDIGVQRIETASLPANWREDSVLTRTFGDEWLRAGAAALLQVPSAIVPETSNMLLNPHHADARSIRVLWHEAFAYDRRIFKVRG